MLETYDNFTRNKKNQKINNKRSSLILLTFNEIKTQEKTISTKINEFSLKDFVGKFQDIKVYIKNESYNFDSMKNKEATSFNIFNNNNKINKKISDRSLLRNKITNEININNTNEENLQKNSKEKSEKIYNFSYNNYNNNQNITTSLITKNIKFEKKSAYDLRLSSEKLIKSKSDLFDLIERDKIIKKDFENFGGFSKKQVSDRKNNFFERRVIDKIKFSKFKTAKIKNDKNNNNSHVVNPGNFELIDFEKNIENKNHNNTREISYTISSDKKNLCLKNLVKKIPKKKENESLKDEKSYLGFKYLRTLVSNLKILPKKKNKGK